MEAVPKLPMISFELKVSSENTHFGPKLKQYIGEAYREDPDSYGNEIHTLEGLRATAIRPTIDAAGLNSLTRYFCQLRAMQSRFPMAKGQPVACTFAWRDVYSNVSYPFPDIRFEMACILYNIGALHTQLAASEPRTSPDSLKAACTHYQKAAWAFLYLREHYPQPPGVDISSDVLRFIQEVCLAQAQECILDKSIQDSKKPSIVGSIATQVMFFYKNSLALLGPSTGTENVHEIVGTKKYNYWHHYLSFKHAYIWCVVSLYQGLNSEEQQKMGERVAFYQQAVEKLGDASKLAKYIEPVQITKEALTFTNDVVEGKRKAAKNENEFIYHEEVPVTDLLVDLKPVCLVKPLAINFNDPDISGPDVFSRLIPIGAHEASSVYSEQLAQLSRKVTGQAEAKTDELLEFMSSLQLDQLDVLDEAQTIPQEIVDRCAAMNAKADVIQSLVESMNSLAEIISDVEHSLTDIKEMIQEETQKEKEYQKVMGPRPPSIVQTELSRELHKYQEAHARTTESNQVLHKAMTLHIANLQLLALPLDQLQYKIPRIENIVGLDRETMLEMRRVVGKAREMQSQRDALLQKLRRDIADDDVTSVLLARSTEPLEDIFKQEIEKHTPQVKILEQNLAAQENIINKLTSLYAAYGESRRLLSDVLRKREGLINALITSYDSYEELLAKSQKGLEFYKKLSLNVNQLLSRLRSTCQVQEEERAQLLSKHSTKAPSRSDTPPVARDVTPAPAARGAGLKLRDCLPYMKNRGAPPVADPVPADNYYPESIYPTSVRPTPVGSEAADLTPMQLPDGVVMSQSQAYNSYTPYSTHGTEPYSVQPNYAFPATSKGYDKLDDTQYGYTNPYTAQYAGQISDPQYTNPYAHNVPPVSVSQNAYPTASNYNQYNYNEQYGATSQHSTNQMLPIPESSMSTYSAANQVNSNELPANFAQMQVGHKDVDYSQTYYNGQYPQTSTPNMATYSYPQASSTNSVQSQKQNFSTVQYPYSADPSMTNQYTQVSQSSYNAGNQPVQTPVQNEVQNPIPNQYNLPTQSVSSPMSNYNVPEPVHYVPYDHGMTIYNNTDSAVTSTTTVANMPVTSTLPAEYSTVPTELSYHDPAALAQLDAMDTPIKSHVTGEALAANINYQSTFQNYDQNAYRTPESVYTNPVEQTTQPISVPYDPAASTYPNQTPNINYVQTFQNHPGYNYNAATGNYDYSYGSQNTSFSNQLNMEGQARGQDSNWQSSMYTSAGNCDTVQSPSETPQPVTQITVDQTSNNQTYYNSPYGYMTTTNQSNEVPPDSVSTATNYGANINQSTYMQSGLQDTSVTYTSPVPTPKEELPQPSFDANAMSENASNNYASEISSQEVTDSKPVDTTPESKPEPKPEPSAFDLLSDIDFSVEQKPLMPEIKVPQISASAIKKSVLPKAESVVRTVKEEPIERPAKMDLFSDPAMLNKFTQEVKKLQNLTDSLTKKAAGGLTVLDSKWKMFQDVQAKENMVRSKLVASEHAQGNIVTEVVPYDDSRLQLKANPDAYINASYYKQLAPWCIPLVIANNPSEKELATFWRAVLENKLACVVCLLSEIDMQGNSYWPTAKGQTLDLEGVSVTLNDVTCTVHWTERRLAVTEGKQTLSVTHYQINVFPAKIVCSPLVLLADRMLSETYEGRLSNQLTGAMIQCGAGAGRSAVVALLAMVMCQVRAGQLELCDMLDAGCVNLYKHRTNVLEDTKYLADAYRTVLFYVQGVLCSGTTMFNGETISVPMGSSILPPPTPTATSTNQKGQKFSRESFEEMKQSPRLTSGDMKDPLNFLDPLWSLKKK